MTQREYVFFYDFVWNNDLQAMFWKMGLFEFENWSQKLTCNSSLALFLQQAGDTRNCLKNLPPRCHKAQIHPGHGEDRQKLKLHVLRADLGYQKQKIVDQGTESFLYPLKLQIFFLNKYYKYYGMNPKILKRDESIQNYIFSFWRFTIVTKHAAFMLDWKPATSVDSEGSGRIELSSGYYFHFPEIAWSFLDAKYYDWRKWQNFGINCWIVRIDSDKNIL